MSEYNKILDAFQAQGYNEIDTARVYVNGKQEAFTAAANWKDRGLTIATKCYPSKPGMHTKDEITASLTKSLEELKTDCVDIFYLHAPDRSVPFKETLEAVNEMHKAGKFVQLGLSNYTAFEVAEIVMTCKANGYVRPTIYQGMYNAITRSIETELFVACRRYGLDIVIYNPLAGGLFSGKYKTKDDRLGEGRFDDSSGPVAARYRERYFRDSFFDSLALIEPVVEKNGLTMLETALRWCVHHSKLNVKDGGNDGIIIGVSSLAQLEGNLKDVNKGPLPEEVVKVLNEAWLLCKATTPNYWHLDLNYTYDTQKSLFRQD